jgi:hypothetical protein
VLRARVWWRATGGLPGRASTQQVTAKGYDTMTGLGTPDGAALMTGPRRAAGCSQ